ncbi:hypothetical protein CN514_01005 [Bacillus sp. AFS001701]|nr:hypothetical protein CN514_01005 [Bacillus sp. AFS001701]
MVKLISAHLFRLIFFYVCIYLIVNNSFLKLMLITIITVIPLIQLKIDKKTNIKKKLVWIIANLDSIMMGLIFFIYLIQEKFSINYFGFIVTGLLIYITGKGKKK